MRRFFPLFDEAGEEGAPAGGGAPADQNGENQDYSDIIAIAGGEGEEGASPVSASQPAAVPPSVPAAAAAAAAPVPAAVPPQVPAAPAAVAPAPAPSSAAVPAAAAPVATAAEPPEQHQARLATARAAAEAEIAKRVTFTDQEISDLQMNPEKVLPGLVAKLHLDVFEGVFAAVMSAVETRMAAVPETIQRHQAGQQAAQELQTDFNKIFPQFADGKNNAFVQKAAELYYAANAEAKAKGHAYMPEHRDRILREIGGLALVLAKLPLTSVAAAPAAAGPQPVNTRPRPFVPAVGGGPAIAPAVGVENFFSDLVDEFAAADQRAS